MTGAEGQVRLAEMEEENEALRQEAEKRRVAALEEENEALR